MALVIVVSACAAFLRDEPLTVVFAALFCFVSAIGIWFLLYFAGKNLLETLAIVISRKSLLPFVMKARWGFVYGCVIIWLIVALSISNFVSSESVAFAQYFVRSGWILGPICVLSFHFKTRFQKVRFPVKDGIQEVD